MRIRNDLRVLPVILALTLIGCGEDNSPGPGISGGCGVLGTSNVSVTGAASAAVNGCAFYGVSTDPSNPVFVVTLTGGSAADPTHTLTFGRNSVRPAVGTYSIGTASGNMDGGLVIEGSTNRSFALTSGTINITTSSPGTLNGSVNLTATETSAPANSVTITGSFAARCFATSTSSC